MLWMFLCVGSGCQWKLWSGCGMVGEGSVMVFDVDVCLVKVFLFAWVEVQFYDGVYVCRGVSGRLGIGSWYVWLFFEWFIL